MSIGVFIADDHGVVREGLRALLQLEGDIEVVGDAGDGRDGVRQIARLCPDVAIMDIAMPELNGIEATRQIKAVSPSTKVVILSMHCTSEHVRRALLAGARGYVLKESASHEMVSAVRSVHAGGQYLDAAVMELAVDELRDVLRTGQAIPDPLSPLSAREREVLQLVVEGKSTAGIAEILCLAKKSVETYRSRMMAKLGIPNVVLLTKWAIRHGITTAD